MILLKTLPYIKTNIIAKIYIIPRVTKQPSVDFSLLHNYKILFKEDLSSY